MSDTLKVILLGLGLTSLTVLAALHVVPGVAVIAAVTAIAGNLAPGILLPKGPTP